MGNRDILQFEIEFPCTVQQIIADAGGHLEEACRFQFRGGIPWILYARVLFVWWVLQHRIGQQCSSIFRSQSTEEHVRHSPNPNSDKSLVNVRRPVVIVPEVLWRPFAYPSNQSSLKYSDKIWHGKILWGQILGNIPWVWCGSHKEWHVEAKESKNVYLLQQPTKLSAQSFDSLDIVCTLSFTPENLSNMTARYPPGTS